MTKSELIQTIARETGISRADTELVVNLYMHHIRKALQKGDKVYLRTFGTFFAKKCPPRRYHNIHTQQKNMAPSKEVPTFRPSHLFLKQGEKPLPDTPSS